LERILYLLLVTAAESCQQKGCFEMDENRKMGDMTVKEYRKAKKKEERKISVATIIFWIVIATLIYTTPYIEISNRVSYIHYIEVCIDRRDVWSFEKLTFEECKEYDKSTKEIEV